MPSNQVTPSPFVPTRMANGCTLKPERVYRDNVGNPRQPDRGPGGYGTASEFGSLDGWTIEEADQYLTKHPALWRLAVTGTGYRHYIFADKSEIWIRPDGQLIRIPHRMYNADGS